MEDSSSPSKSAGPARLSPDEAFGLLSDGTRVDILLALWDTFESGRGGNDVPYAELMDRVGMRDSGNFSYHLQKLIGPFVRKTEHGYELKQTGINVVRGVVAGTVIGDPEINPTAVDIACPICGAPVEVAYADELMAASCTACEGILRWNEVPGILFLGLVPPACVEGRSAEGALRAAVTCTFYEMAALLDNVCPHCSRPIETTVNVCPAHNPESETLCSNCHRRHLAEAWIVCSTCKRSVFPPVATAVLAQPTVIAFYCDHGINHRFASWETVARRTEVNEELLSEDPLRVRVTIPAGDDEHRVTLDEELCVLDVST